MRGERIEIARQCMTLLLRCLPSHSTVFNIFLFSTSHAHLWPQSRTYNDPNVQEAVGSVSFHQLAGIYTNMWPSQITYVSGLRTNPGTKLGTAMRALLDSRRTSVPTAVFILTDGEVFGVSY